MADWRETNYETKIIFKVELQEEELYAIVPIRNYVKGMNTSKLRPGDARPRNVLSVDGSANPKGNVIGTFTSLALFV